MTLTPEQQLLLPELEAHNASITQSNEAAAAHNALLPPGTEPVPIRPLLTMAEYIQYKLDQVAEAEARRVQAAAKTNEQWQAEWTAMNAQLNAVTAEKNALYIENEANKIEAAKVTTLEAEKTTLTTEKATANVTIATLTSEKADLQSQLTETSGHLLQKMDHIDELQTEKAELERQLSEKTTLANSQATAITTLESQLQEVTEAKEVLFIRKQAVDSDLSEANAKIAFLHSIRTYDSNQIRSLAFYDRITKNQINKLGLLAINDPQAAEIHQLLNDYKDNPWPVLFDDPLVIGGIQYLLYLEIITQEEAAQITRPATREEAYFAP